MLYIFHISKLTDSVYVAGTFPFLFFKWAPAGTDRSFLGGKTLTDRQSDGQRWLAGSSIRIKERKKKMRRVRREVPGRTAGRTKTRFHSFPTFLLR